MMWLDCPCGARFRPTDPDEGSCPQCGALYSSISKAYPGEPDEYSWSSPRRVKIGKSRTTYRQFRAAMLRWIKYLRSVRETKEGEDNGAS